MKQALNNIVENFAISQEMTTMVDNIDALGSHKQIGFKFQPISTPLNDRNDFGLTTTKYGLKKRW